jgi:flagellar basal-body rod modification protein FlgD
MHKISANYSLPTIMNTLKPTATNGLLKGGGLKANTAAAAATSSSTSSSTSAGGLGTTFLSLLAQELQNQDPTAPVDPTAMVGQMISLNQLEQLISINQTIGTSSTATSSAVQGTAAAASDPTSTLSPSTAGAAMNQLPFDPNTMMPLTSGNAGSVAATINSSINAANLGLSGTNNNTSGGK